MSGSLLKFEKRYSVKIGGRRYPVVKIGNQLWMAENLDWKFDVNGSQIPIGQSSTPTTPAAWYYNNDEASYGIDGTYKCGLLYNWYAAKYLDDNKATLLPDEWHVPNVSEYDSLESIVSQSDGGTKLKALDNSITASWPSNWNGTDNYGFKAVPTGFRDDSGFHQFGEHAHYWLYEAYSSTHAYSWYAGDFAYIGSSIYNPKTSSFSLRLVKSLT